MPDSITVEHFEVGLLQCVCTIVADTTSGEAIVAELGVRATYLVHTHAHFDHIGCLGELRELTGARGLLHAADLPLYRQQDKLTRAFGLPPVKIVSIDGDLRQGDRLNAGAATLEVLHTPGHTPGSASFAVTTGDGAPLLLTGDTLFRGGVGRWDIGGTSLEDIVASIRAKLFAYPDATIVVPGHGPQTTIGTERRENPFLISAV
jgi:hydroxyacylglutathione hydrolase